MVHHKYFFYFTDHRCHLQAIKSYLNPCQRGFYVNFNAHKRYPFLTSVYQLKPHLFQNAKYKSYIEALFVKSISHLPVYHLSNLVEYTQCLNALLVNSALYGIVSSEIITDNILKLSNDSPSLCFSKNDSLLSLFAIYLVAHKLTNLDINYRLFEVNDNMFISRDDGIMFIFAVIQQALMPDQSLFRELVLIAEQHGSVVVSGAVKKDILAAFESRLIFSSNSYSPPIFTNLAHNYLGQSRNTQLHGKLLSDKFAIINCLSSNLIEYMHDLESNYNQIENGKLYLSCAPLLYTPAILILGRLLFSRIYLLPHSDIPSYEIPHQMYDYQVVSRSSFVGSDPCGQQTDALNIKEVILNEI